MQALFGQDVVISFPEHGFHLRFEPRSQRLRLIEVYDVTRLQVSTSELLRPSSIGLPPPLGRPSYVTLASDTLASRHYMYREDFQTPIPVLQVKYGKSLIGGASHPATFVRVYDICGPTYPGEYDPKTRTYTLHYPGLAFLFPIPAQHAEACSENHIGMPLEFPDGSTPLASRICIYTASEGAHRLQPPYAGSCGAHASP